MIDDLVTRLRSLDIEPSHIVESVALEAAARITELETDNERLKLEAGWHRAAIEWESISNTLSAKCDALAAVVEIVAQSGGQTVTDDLTAMALRALGRGL